MIKQFSLTTTINQAAPIFGAAGLSSLAIFAVPEVAEAVAPFSPFEQINMGAELLKPYTEIEYNGQIYAIKNLLGGHNGRNSLLAEVVAACQTNPPIFDPVSNTWRVPVTNNFIYFSTDSSPLGKINLGALNDTVEGYLEFPDNPSNLDELDFPIDSIFSFQVKLELVDLGVTLFSEEEITVYANGLSSWVPPVGTTYYQDENIDLVAMYGGPTIATIMPDTTIVTEVISSTADVPEPTTSLACVTALGFGGILKRKSDKKNKKEQKT